MEISVISNSLKISIFRGVLGLISDSNIVSVSYLHEGCNSRSTIEHWEEKRRGVLQMEQSAYLAKEHLLIPE